MREEEHPTSRRQTRVGPSVLGIALLTPLARAPMLRLARGQLLLRYEGPTRSRKGVEQSVEQRLCASEGGPIPDGPVSAGPAATSQGPQWVTREVFQQSNLEQGTSGTYVVLSTFRLEGDGAVRLQQRVAAFLQPTDGAYFDALGKPVALYDYAFALRRL